MDWKASSESCSAVCSLWAWFPSVISAQALLAAQLEAGDVTSPKYGPNAAPIYACDFLAA